MGNKHQEIEKIKKEQAFIKEEIKNIKSKTPKQIGIYILLVALFILFFDKKLYPYFGNSIAFIKIAIAFFVFLGILFLIRKKYILKSKNNILDKVNAKLYQLMKLDLDDE